MSKNILLAISLITTFNYLQAADISKAIEIRLAELEQQLLEKNAGKGTKTIVEQLKDQLKEEKFDARSGWEAGRFGRATRRLSGLSAEETREILKDVNDDRKEARKNIAKIEKTLHTLMALTCDRCKEPAALFKCSRCKVSYCSKGCQKAAWKDNHRAVCKMSVL